MPAAVAEHATSVGAEAVALSARIENELAELGADEAAEMRSEYGLTESGLERLTLAAYSLLGLITFYTAGEGKEAMARSLRRGSSALDAAAVVHTEIAAAFVKAEVIGWRRSDRLRRLRRRPRPGPAADRGPRLRRPRRRRDHDSELNALPRRRMWDLADIRGQIVHSTTECDERRPQVC